MDLQSSISTSQQLLTTLQSKLSYATAQYNLSTSSSSSTSSSKHQKLRILTLLKQIKTLPLKPTSSSKSTLSTSLANTQLRLQFKNDRSYKLSSQSLSQELQIQLNISTILDSLISNLSSLPLESKITPDDKISLLLNRIDSLKSNSRKLSSYIKILVNDYLFNQELAHIFKNSDPEAIKSKKQKFLKLLEALLNNNILHPNSTTNHWLTLNSMDDPLVRFLIINRLITVHPTIPNKIMLKDLSVDL